MKTRKKRPLLITGFLIGTGILLMAYPFVSNSLYEHRQEEVIYEYQKETDKMDTTAGKMQDRACFFSDWAVYLLYVNILLPYARHKYYKRLECQPKF